MRLPKPVARRSELRPRYARAVFEKAQRPSAVAGLPDLRYPVSPRCSVVPQKIPILWNRIVVVIHGGIPSERPDVRVTCDEGLEDLEDPDEHGHARLRFIVWELLKTAYRLPCETTNEHPACIAIREGVGALSSPWKWIKRRPA